MKSSIRRKVQMLLELVIPLLVKNNFVDFDLSERTLARAKSTRPITLRSYKSFGKVEVAGSKPA
jgi:hypothetical protein